MMVVIVTDGTGDDWSMVEVVALEAAVVSTAADAMAVEVVVMVVVKVMVVEMMVVIRTVVLIVGAGMALMGSRGGGSLDSVSRTSSKKNATRDANRKMQKSAFCR